MSIVVLLVLLLFVFQMAAQPLDFSDRMTNIGATVQRSTRRVAKAFQSGGSHSRITIRDASTAALANLGAGGSVDQTKTWLRAVLKTQNVKTGELPWDFTGAIKDANSIEFGVQAWGPIALNYPTQMSDFMSEFLPHIRLAVKALRSHQRTTTTNIHLSNIVSQLLLGEVLQDNSIIENATALLRHWAGHTQANGLTEFGSPTYYGEDLNALAIGYACTKVTAAREILHWALRYLWTDIAANWFSPQTSLSGPHSRDSDFLLGTGEIYGWLYAEGWTEELRRAKEVKYFLIEALKNTSTAFRPGNDIRELALLPHKLVISRQTSRKNNLPPFIRMNRITPDFATGSIDINYGSQDKLVTWHLGSNSSHPVISIVPDASDSPYGKVIVPDKNGHMKPLHLLLHPSIVQSDTAMLILLDLDPTESTELKSLVTNIILPASADAILRNGVPVPPQFFTTPTTIPISTDDTITVRVALGCVALRIFYVTPIAGVHTPSLVLQSEASGLSFGAVRLAIYHTSPDVQNVTLPASSHIRVGIISLSQHCEAPEDAAALSKIVSSALVSSKFDDKKKPGTWIATAKFPNVHLSVAKSMEMDRTTIFRRVNGSDQIIPPNGNIIVNGITLDPTKNLGPQINGNGTGNGLVESRTSDTPTVPDYSVNGDREGWQQNVVHKHSQS